MNKSSLDGLCRAGFSFIGILSSTSYWAPSLCSETVNYSIDILEQVRPMEITAIKHVRKMKQILAVYEDHDDEASA